MFFRLRNLDFKDKISECHANTFWKIKLQLLGGTSDQSIN